MGWGWSLEGGRERKARSGLFQGVGSCAVRGISSSAPPSFAESEAGGWGVALPDLLACKLLCLPNAVMLVVVLSSSDAPGAFQFAHPKPAWLRSAALLGFHQLGRG